MHLDMVAVSLERCFTVFLVFTLLRVTLSNSIDSKNPSTLSTKKHSNELYQQQIDHQQQFKKQQERNLNEWVIQELRHNQQFPEVQPYESAVFLLKPNLTQIFRIPVSLAQTMLIEVSLFEMTKNGEIELPINPDQNDYVEVLSIDNTDGVEHDEGKIYISRVFELKFKETHKYLKFKNNIDHPLVVMIDIQQEQLLMQIVVSDDQFQQINKKIRSILQETKSTQINREHMYKWQLGFYQKHERHQSDMLGFTGAELLVIVATSIVQMYCIKNLINNELII